MASVLQWPFCTQKGHNIGEIKGVLSYEHCNSAAGDENAEEADLANIVGYGSGDLANNIGWRMMSMSAH